MTVSVNTFFCFFHSKKVETEYQLQIKDITFDCSTRDYVGLTRNMPI